MTTLPRALGVETTLPRALRARTALACVLRAAAALAVVLCVACCGSIPPPVHPIREAGTILSAIRAREAAVPSVRARGSADQYGRRGRLRGNVVIFVHQPDQVRVDAFAFGNLISSMIINGDRFTLLQGREYATGPSRPCAIAQVLGIALSPREILAVLSGGPPLVSDTLVGPTWENGRYVVTATGDDGVRERIELELPTEQRGFEPDAQRPRVRRVVLSDREGLRAEITYEGYRMVAGVAFPDRVRVVMPRDGGDTMLRFDEIQPNYTIPPDPMDPPGTPPLDPYLQHQPAGTNETPIEC